MNMVLSSYGSMTTILAVGISWNGIRENTEQVCMSSLQLVSRLEVTELFCVFPRVLLHSMK